MTRRGELFPVIKQLREDQGLTWREIGEQLGLNFRTVHDYYSDPDGSATAVRKLQSDASLAGPCARCGATVSKKTARADGYCVSCWRATARAARARRVEAVAEMYRDGMSQKAIAEALGYGPNSSPPEIIEARRRGLIGYRYPTGRVESSRNARWGVVL
jgi:DNA-binding NarL/FixJ family response regulator